MRYHHQHGEGRGSKRGGIRASSSTLPELSAACSREFFARLRYSWQSDGGAAPPRHHVGDINRHWHPAGSSMGWLDLPLLKESQARRYVADLPANVQPQSEASRCRIGRLWL
jgi:hypothetical protein